MKTVKAIPEGSHSLVTHLSLKNAGKAIEFYKKAFDVREIGRVTVPGVKWDMRNSTLKDRAS